MARPRKSVIASTVAAPTQAAAPRVVQVGGYHVSAGTLAERIAQSKIYMGNWCWDIEREHFKDAPRLRTVDKFYPYAQGGPLLVDEPRSAYEVEECKRKAVVLKSLGMRYAYLTLGMQDIDAWEQLR